MMKTMQTKRIDFLKAIPLFSQLSKNYLQKMTAMIQRRELIRNQILFHQEVVSQNGLQQAKKAYQANCNKFINFGLGKRPQMPRFLYIIGTGEFEVSIKTYGPVKPVEVDT